MKFDKVLVPIDGSTLSNAAVDLALHSAGIFATHLTFVYVIDDTGFGEFDENQRRIRSYTLRQDGMKLLDDTKARADAKNTECEVKLAEGIPWQIICEMSKDYDMIIMSITGKGAFGSGQVGSTAAKVIENCYCPVLTLKSGSHRVESVLLPVENDGVPAIEVAIETVKRIKGQLTILCVNSKGEKTDEMIRNIGSRCEEAGIAYESEIMSGDPAQVISGESGKYDLVIMGTHGRKGLRKALKGSVAESVMLNAACPVTVVRNN